MYRNHLEVMRSTTPHIGAEPSVGPKTVVVGFPRVVVECLLALTERAIVVALNSQPLESSVT